MVVAAVCWSSGGYLVRLLSIKDTWQILFWRALFLVLFLAVVLLKMHGRRVLRAVIAVGRPGILSGCLLAGASICFLAALAHTTVTNTYVLMSAAPFFAAIAAWYVLREPIPRITWVAMFLAAAGIVVVFSEALGTRSIIGDLLALGVCCCFAAQITTLRKFGRVVDMLPQVLIAGLVALAAGLVVSNRFAVDARDLLILAALGCLQLGVGSSLSTRAARHLSASEIGLIALLEPILGPAWVWAFLGDRPNASALYGGLIVVAAVCANQIWRYRRLRSGGDAAPFPADFR
jgi:drug/metabolite transporter (DMT)-like permease